MLCEVLTLHGHETRSVATFEEACAEVVALQPGLLLLDHQLVGDPARLRHVRAQVARHLTIVIASTAPLPVELRNEWGADRYLLKPFHATDLLVTDA